MSRRSSERGRGDAGRERPDHRRLAVADEAARILAEEGQTDFRAAKAKAAERLGLGRNVPLPSNVEVAAALAERQRVFAGESHAELLLELRLAACAVMRELRRFHPRLVGDVLRGDATGHGGVELHVFSDTAEEVGAVLDDLGLQHRSVLRRHRLRPDEAEAFPAFRFHAGAVEFTASVFPLDLRGHAPRSPVDGRPMRRAELREVEELVAGAPPGAGTEP